MNGKCDAFSGLDTMGGTDFPDVLIDEYHDANIDIDSKIDDFMMPPNIDDYRDTNIAVETDDKDDNIVNKIEKKLQTALSKMPFVNVQLRS